jgi:hypothetical protein
MSDGKNVRKALIGTLSGVADDALLSLHMISLEITEHGVIVRLDPPTLDVNLDAQRNTF